MTLRQTLCVSITKISELHESPQNLASVLMDHSEERKVIVCLCKTDQTMEDISSYITSLNQIVPASSSCSVLLLVVTPSEDAAQQQAPKAQNRIDAESAILTWSTQMSACEGLFEFSAGATPEESVGMNEFLEGVIELGEQQLLSNPTVTPVLSRASSSELGSDTSSASSSSFAESNTQAQTSPRVATETWTSTSPRPNWSAHVPSPRIEHNAATAVSQQRKSPEQASSETSGAQKSWLGASPRDPATPSTSAWSSGTRPNTARNPRTWLSHTPQNSNDSPTFAPLSVRVPISSSALSSAPASGNASPNISVPQSTILREPRDTKGQTSPQSPSAGAKATPAKLTSSVSTSQLNSPIRAISHTLSGNLGLKKKTSANCSCFNISMS